jgi:superfamily I DNA/RNA helicase
MDLPDLKPTISGKKNIKLLEFENDNLEFQFVINKIISCLKSEIPANEIFVLARTNRQLEDLSKLLKQKNIKHIIKADEVKKPVFARSDDITLATIHSIKGLEAQLVFVIGCNEQNFPCKASDHPIIELVKLEDYDKEEEEKRIFYVALSRAKDQLFLTYSGKKPTYFMTEEMTDYLKD